MAKTAKQPTKQTETKPTKAKAEDRRKLIEVKVTKAVEKVAVSKKKTEDRPVGKQAVTATEIKAEKKIKAKMNKEDDVARRLNRAKSSLSAGIAAAMMADSKGTGEVKNVEPAKSFGYANPTPPASSARNMTKSVSFDALNTEPVAQAQVAKKPVTPLKATGGKVSFDDLMANAAATQDQGVEFTYKK